MYNFVILQKAPDGSVTDVYWHQDGNRLLTEAEAREWAAEDNELDEDGYRSIVAEVREIGEPT